MTNNPKEDCNNLQIIYILLSFSNVSGISVTLSTTSASSPESAHDKSEKVSETKMVINFKQEVNIGFSM